MIWERLLRAANRLSPVYRWVLAFLFLATATLVRHWLSPLLSAAPFITFAPAIVGAALLCGWPAATAALLASGAIAWVAFWPSGPGPAPVATGDVPWPPLEKLVATTLYFINSAFVIVLITALLGAVRSNHRLVRQQQTLFRELQHRVANSLQFIASMLHLARQQAAGAPEAQAVLEDAAARIAATGKLHRRLHDAAAFAEGFQPLLHDILTDLFRDVPVVVAIDTHGIALPLSRMTPVVLLVTEAATNALKHVFLPGLGRHFTVTLAHDGAELRLAIGDDGPGPDPITLPAATTPRRTGLGMQIMTSLAAQLGGKLDVRPEPGIAISVRFRGV